MKILLLLVVLAGILTGGVLAVIASDHSAAKDLRAADRAARHELFGTAF